MTVVFILFIYFLVIVSALKLRGQDDGNDTFRAPTVLLYPGLLGNLVVFVYVLWDDPAALLWVGGLLALGGALYAAQRFSGQKVPRGDAVQRPPTGTPEGA